jgi:hypothetical protein
MKAKGLIFISCLAAGALIASPAFGKPAKNLKMRQCRSQNEHLRKRYT